MNRRFVQLATMDRLKISYFRLQVLRTSKVDGLEPKRMVRDRSFVLRIHGQSLRLGHICFWLTFDWTLIFDNVIFHISISIVMWCTPAVFKDNSKISWCFECFRNQWSFKIDFDIQNFFQGQYRWFWNFFKDHVISTEHHVTNEESCDWCGEGSRVSGSLLNLCKYNLDASSHSIE